MMSPYRSPRNWKIAIVSLVIVAAFALASFAIYRASQTGKDSREALCQVLLFVRNASLHPEPPEQPPTESEVAEIDAFYAQLLGLIEGCQIPPTEST